MTAVDGSWNRENWSCNGSWNRDITCSTIKKIGLKYETKDIRGTFAVESESAPETALLIEGARRVGKSWIVEEFAKREYRSYILIDFNKVSKVVLDIFNNDLEDLDVFFRRISEYFGVRLYEGESLFVFDEVQEFPRARAAIKYLVADGRYHFIETGSLISIAKNVTGIVIPSEEDSIKMHPLDFEEFLWATDRANMIDVIKDHRRDLSPFGAVHRKIKEAFREYLVVGGMPQAVACWAETHDLKKVEATKKRILKLYRNDIRKHAGRYAMKAEAVFDEIPSQLQGHDKKFRLAAIGGDARMREYGDAFLWLKDSMIVNIAYNSSEPTAGLRLSAEYSTLKCYALWRRVLCCSACRIGSIVKKLPPRHKICKFRAYHYRRKNVIMLTLFDGEIISLDESKGDFMATSSITANFYCDDAKAANAFVRMLVRPAGCVKSDSNVAHAHKFETEKESKAFYMKTLATARKVLSGRSRSSCRRNAK